MVAVLSRCGPLSWSTNAGPGRRLMRRSYRGSADLPKLTLERCLDGDDSSGGAL